MATLFASILNWSVMLGNEDFSRQHFQMHFFLGALRVKVIYKEIVAILQTNIVLI